MIEQVHLAKVDDWNHGGTGLNSDLAEAFPIFEHQSVVVWPAMQRFSGATNHQDNGIGSSTVFVGRMVWIVGSRQHGHDAFGGTRSETPAQENLPEERNDEVKV